MKFVGYRMVDEYVLISRAFADVNLLVEEGVPHNFEFPNIYSGGKSVGYYSVHQDGAFHKIKYYFANKRHPIVFINTANHAMSFHDTNLASGNGSILLGKIIVQ